MIPKIIVQTYKRNRFPLPTRLFIWWMRLINWNYHYAFYDDARIEQFLSEHYPPEVLVSYQKLAIGAAKGDFFRYAFLNIKGGVYIDIDGGIIRSLKHIIKPDDEAVISNEGKHDHQFCQFALISAPHHPFIKRALEICMDNIAHNRFPHSVHAMTGPSVFTQAVDECLRKNPSIPYRIVGENYDRKKITVIISSHFLYRLIYFGSPNWRKVERLKTVLK